MADEIQSFKLVSSGGLNSNQNHLFLAEASPGAATRLVNYEPSLYGGYRRIEGFGLLEDLNVEVGQGVAEGPVLCVAIYRNEHLGNPYIIAARKEKKLLTSSSLLAISFAEMNINKAIIIPVKNSITGEALTNTIVIFF